MKKKWNITISKTGVIEVLAETEEEAIKIADSMKPENQIYWEDAWSIVDVQEEI